MKKLLFGIILAFIGLMVSASASAIPVNLGDSISATQVPNTWYTDRYAPDSFDYDVDSGVLSVRINADDGASARPSEFSSSFYNTQGRKHDLSIGVTWMNIELYVPGDPLQQRLAGFWGTGVDGMNAITSYPILEFALGGLGGPRFQGWNECQLG